MFWLVFFWLTQIWGFGDAHYHSSTTRAMKCWISPNIQQTPWMVRSLAQLLRSKGPTPSFLHRKQSDLGVRCFLTSLYGR